MTRSGDPPIKPHLDRLYKKFDISFLEPDPLAAALPYRNNEDDLAVAALFAALFAYGRADLIQRNVGKILDAMEGSPSRFCVDFKPGKNSRWMKDFRYRFQTRPDLVSLVTSIGAAINEYGSLKSLFLAHDDPEAETVLPGVAGLAQDILRRSKNKTPGFVHLIANPANGGAAKRLNLFMRWMVRKDKVDPGPWRDAVSPSRLIIPLDIHVGRIARLLGILNRKSNDGKAAIELTRFLRRLDHKDPVKYDFAICSFGKLGYCVKNITLKRCESCDLSPVCGKIF